MLSGKALYLIDCGETMFDVLYHKLDLASIEDVYVILTHMHADHVGSLGTLISYFYCLFNKAIHVVYPQETIKQLLTLEGITPLGYHYHETLPENPAGLTAVPVEVKHALDMKCYGYVLSDGTETIYYSGDSSELPEDMKCYGYVLSDGTETIYYSGDSSELPEDIRTRFLAGEIGRIYHDTSTHDSPNPSHCYYGKMEKWIPREERHRVYCMHLDSPCEDMLKEKGFSIVEVVEG